MHRVGVTASLVSAFQTGIAQNVTSNVLHQTMEPEEITDAWSFGLLSTP